MNGFARSADPEKVARIVRAFQDPPPSKTERRVIQVLLENPGQSSAFLTSKCGWRGQSWHMHFGKMCRRRGRLLWPAPYEARRRADFYTGILTDFDETTRGFTLKPEAVEGFRQVGSEPERGSTMGVAG